jgi:hypothetical protein
MTRHHEVREGHEGFGSCYIFNFLNFVLFAIFVVKMSVSIFAALRR